VVFGSLILLKTSRFELLRNLKIKKPLNHVLILKFWNKKISSSLNIFEIKTALGHGFVNISKELANFII
jgi:hypothetical protein